MSDLRTRIAAAVSEALDQWLQARGNTTTRFDVNYIVADAVIAELGLTKEDEYNPYDPFPPPYRVRYVTEWEPDE